jgi:hypothetical protein
MNKTTVAAGSQLKTLANFIFSFPSLLSLHRSGGAGAGHIGRRLRRGKPQPEQIRPAPSPLLFLSLPRAVQQQVKMARLPVPSPARAFAKAERVAVERPGDRALDRDPSCRSFERDWQRESPR